MSLDERTRRALDRLMGPWFVLDEVNPSGPGVSWKKMLSLIERGKVTPETIVRGPATGGQWRFAGQSPSVATRLGLCWSCQSPLPPVRTASVCEQCGAALNGPVNWPDELDVAPAAPVSSADEEPARAIPTARGVRAARGGGNGKAPLVAPVVARPPKAAPPPPAEEPPSAGEPPSAEESALDDLILAGAPAPTPNGRGGPAARTAVKGPSRLVPAVGFVAAGIFVAGLVVAVLKLTHDNPPQPVRRDGSGAGASRTGDWPGWDDSPAPAAPERQGEPKLRPLPGAMPGELFPEVPSQDPRLPSSENPARRPSTGPRHKPPRDPGRAALPETGADDLARQRRDADRRFAEARQAAAKGDLMKAQKLLVGLINSCDPRVLPGGAMPALQALQKKIAEGDRLSDEELARQKALAKGLFDRAAQLRKRGKLMDAQVMLVRMLSMYDRNAWPAGAMQTLGDIQARLVAAGPAGKDPAPDELTRQRASAGKLFDQATRLIDKSDLVAAQKPLLEILNSYHPKAWPDGALEAFRKIQEAFRKSPTSAPSFFDIKPKK